MKALTCPEYRAIFSIPNGGKRTSQAGAKLNREGLEAGAPDICIAVPRAPYHGAFIEMKYGRGVATEDQKWWLLLLQENGYKVAICYNSGVAIDWLEEYLHGKKQ